MLVALAAIWGSSFLFIKVAVRHLHPEAVVFGRLVFGVATLGIFLLWRGEMREAVSALVPMTVRATSSVRHAFRRSSASV